MTTAGSISPELAAPRQGVNPWFIALTVTLATFMEVLDTSIANVALPHIAGSLSASTDEATWVLTSYLIANAIILPLNDFFGRLIGRKTFYMSCVALFTVSSFLCGIAPNLMTLVFFRILQGAGGGGLQPSEQAILVDTFPPAKRGMAMAVYGMAVVVAPVLGPTLGGWITDQYSWRWIFFINIPVGILSLILTSQLIHDPPEMVRARKTRRRLPRIDYIGLGLLAVGLGALQMVLDRGQQDDWFGSTFITVALIIALTCLVSAVTWEWLHPEPVVNFRLLKERNFLMVTLVMLAFGGVLYSTTTAIPLLTQNLLGYTAMQAGLALSPGALVVMLMLPAVGWIMTKIESRWIVLFGLVVCGLAVIHMGSFYLQVNFSSIMWARIYQAIGLGCLFVPINTTAYNYIPKKMTDSASGLINLARNVGGSVGISLMTTCVAQWSQVHRVGLVDKVAPANAQYHSLLRGMEHTLAAHGGAGDLNMQAVARVGAMIHNQSQMLAYIDMFRWFGLALLFAVPLVFLMKKSPPGGAAHH